MGDVDIKGFLNARDVLVRAFMYDTVAVVVGTALWFVSLVAVGR